VSPATECLFFHYTTYYESQGHQVPQLNAVKFRGRGQRVPRTRSRPRPKFWLRGFNISDSYTRPILLLLYDRSIGVILNALERLDFNRGVHHTIHRRP